MGRLFELKEWLTVEETARHLSTVFSEPVADADVLRLALDGHLTLSINFVNHAHARRGRVVPMESAHLWEVPAELAESLNLNRKDATKPLMMLKGINIDDERVLELAPEIVTLDGVYDLPMIGAEKLDVEHAYQRLTGGPEITLSCLDGAFVQEDELILLQLQESYEDNEYMRGSRAALKRLETRIENGELDRSEADRLLKRHAEDRKEFLKNRRTRPKESGYHPAGGLPTDAVFVVRTRTLREFQQRLDPIGVESSGKLASRAETTYRNIIGALLHLILGQTPSGKPHSLFKDQSAVIEALLATHQDKPGISQRTLEAKFAAAKRSLDAG